jgi:hypothetical protein
MRILTVSTDLTSLQSPIKVQNCSQTLESFLMGEIYHRLSCLALVSVTFLNFKMMVVASITLQTILTKKKKTIKISEQILVKYVTDVKRFYYNINMTAINLVKFLHNFVLGPDFKSWWQIGGAAQMCCYLCPTH